MIIIDTALQDRQSRGEPIRVGMVGAGFMARGTARQIAGHVPGMVLSAICNRTRDRAEAMCREVGVRNVEHADDPQAIARVAGQGGCAITDDYVVLCESEAVDVVLEMTGHVEYGAHIALKAFDSGKPFVTMNAELDATVGPLLKRKADEAGVVYTLADGDQPGVEMNLYRFVTGLGGRPVLCGNIKGLHDPYRNPTTQEGYARKWNQNVYMVTSFADGTKISFEQALVGNAVGMTVAKTGMLGPTVPAGTPVEEAAQWYPHEELLEGPGIVDYVVGASPAPGVFILAVFDDDIQQEYLKYLKLGDGPLYCFYTPYHLCSFEVPGSVARAVLYGDATIAPKGEPYVDVVAAAKTALEPGATIDGLGGYSTYGLCESYRESRRMNLLPMGLAEGCVLKRAVPKDQIITRDDVDIPEGRLAHELRQEQDGLFPPETN
ncbi:MAG: NAD(P)H-dependent oxidoreductase [Oceanidesulfovibrio sp.]